MGFFSRMRSRRQMRLADPTTDLDRSFHDTLEEAAPAGVALPPPSPGGPKRSVAARSARPAPPRPTRTAIRPTASTRRGSTVTASTVAAPATSPGAFRHGDCPVAHRSADTLSRCRHT